MTDIKIPRRPGPHPLHQNRIWLLALMMAGAAALRYFMAAAASSAPSIIMDEALYASISHSLYESGQVLLRGQPTIYEYLLYPLLLAPLHLLPASFSFFRAVQMFNAIAISLSAIPAYLIGKRVTASSQKGLFIALLVLILPDMVMVRHVMSESITYPLTLLLIYFFIMAVEKKSNLYAALMGGIAALLHMTKPGVIVVAVVFAAVFLVLALMEKDIQWMAAALYAAGVFVLLFAAYQMMLHNVFGVDPSRADYYASQMRALNWDNIAKALNGALVYALYVPAAFFVVPFVVPLFQSGRFRRRRRAVLMGIFGALIAFIAVIIWTIYIGELKDEAFVTRIHTRYIVMFLPVLVAFFLSGELKGARVNAGLATACTGLAAGWIFLAGGDLISGKRYPVDAHLLSTYLAEEPLNGAIWLPMVWIVLTMYIISSMAQKGLRRKDTGVVSLVLCAFLLIGNVVSYGFDNHTPNLYVKKNAEEAMELAGENAMYITQKGQLFWEAAMAIDMAYRGSIPMVESDDAVLATGELGIMDSFTPAKLSKAVAAVAVEPGAAFIIHHGLIKKLTLSKGTTVTYTKEGTYAIVTPDENGGWLHSAPYRLKDGKVEEGSGLAIFDREVLAHDTILLKVRAKAEEGSANLLVSCGSQDEVLPLSDTLSWVSLELEVSAEEGCMLIDFLAMDGGVIVEDYLVQGHR